MWRVGLLGIEGMVPILSLVMFPVEKIRWWRLAWAVLGLWWITGLAHHWLGYAWGTPKQSVAFGLIVFRDLVLDLVILGFYFRLLAVAAQLWERKAETKVLEPAS